jgi:hypothetical protein
MDRAGLLATVGDWNMQVDLNKTKKEAYYHWKKAGRPAEPTQWQPTH